jgi:hypothetical protein
MNSTRCWRKPCFAFLAATTAAFAMAGCGYAIGKCGAYTDTEGTARITSISTAPADQNNCRNDPVRVLSDFTPADPARASLSASGVMLLIGSGLNPSRAWVTASGIAVGTDLPVTRTDQPVGPCPPTNWIFTSIDQTAAIAACN